MFAAQRMELIKDILIKNKTVDVSTLISILNVSDVTVRKDLDKLEKEGFLYKTHGGAILCETKSSETSERLIIRNHTAKTKIVELAMTLIDDNDSIFIGHGSTCYLLSQHIKKMKNVSVVTNNIAASNEIMDSIRNTYLLGGEIDDVDGIPYTTGPNSLNDLNNIFVNKAFISVGGIDLMAGLTCDNLNKKNILKSVTSISKNIIVLADNEKFGRIGMYHIAPLDIISCLITNHCDNNEYKTAMFQKNIKFLTAFEI